MRSFFKSSFSFLTRRSRVKTSSINKSPKIMDLTPSLMVKTPDAFTPVLKGDSLRKEFLDQLSRKYMIRINGSILGSLDECIKKSTYKVDVPSMKWIYNCIRNKYEYPEWDGHSGMSWEWTKREARNIEHSGIQLLENHLGLDYVDSIKRNTPDLYEELAMVYGFRKWINTKNAMGYKYFAKVFSDRGYTIK